MILNYLLIEILNILSSKIRSIRKFSVYLSIIFVFIIISGNLSSPDSLNYIRGYYAASFSNLQFGLEYGFNLLEAIFSVSKLDYIWFRSFLVVILLFNYTTFIRRYCSKENIVWFLYLLYLIFMDAEQVRNAVAFSFVLRGISAFLDNKTITFVFWIIIGMSFHTICIIYFVLLIIPHLKKKNVKKISILIFIFLLIALQSGLQNRIISILSLMSTDKYSSYFSVNSSLGAIYIVIIQTAMLLLLRFCQNRMNKSVVKKDDYIHFNKLFRYCLVVSCIGLPLCMLSLTFYRVIRNLLFLEFICFSISISYMKRKTMKKYFIIMTMIIIIAGWFYIDFVAKNHIEDVLIPIIHDNYWTKVLDGGTYYGN